MTKLKRQQIIAKKLQFNVHCAAHFYKVSLKSHF